MLFYRTAHTYRHEGQAAVSTTHRPVTTPTTEYPMRAPWMLKCLVVGTALLVLAYWLVQIAGAQYLATLTSATLLSFLLVYIVWCLTVKRRQAPQHAESATSSEPPVLPTTSGISPSSSLHPALKHYGVPPRECSPPPSYDEVLRQMGAAAAAAAAAASTSGASPSTCCDVEAPPEDIEAPSSSSTLPVCTIETHEETHVANTLEGTSITQESSPNDACLPSTSSTTDENLSAMSSASVSESTTSPNDCDKENKVVSRSGSFQTRELPKLTSDAAVETPISTSETVEEVENQPALAEATPGEASTTSTTVDVSIEIA